MNRQLGLALLFLLVTAGSAYSQKDGSDRLDASRSRTEARYGTVGNQPQTETIVRERIKTITVPDTSGSTSQGLVAGRVKPPKKKQVLVRETVTVTRPAPLRVNPY